MKKTETLKKNYEFRKVLNKGNYISGKNIELFFMKNYTNKNFIGIAISSKIAKANKRNKIKRLIRENYKNIENIINNGISMVFLWKKNRDIKEATYKNIQQDMLKIIKEMDVNKNV